MPIYFVSHYIFIFNQSEGTEVKYRKLSIFPRGAQSEGVSLKINYFG